MSRKFITITRIIFVWFPITRSGLPAVIIVMQNAVLSAFTNVLFGIITYIYPLNGRTFSRH